MMDGIVISSLCGTYKVDVAGIIYQVTARGIFRNKAQQIVVGDNVSIDDSGSVIMEVKPRQSFLNRPLIANVSKILIVLSLKEPDFSYLLALKYLTVANYNHLPCYLIVSKSDIVDEKKIDEIKSIFNILNVPTFFISNKTKEGIEKVKGLLNDGVICLMGQTGVGKSSLLNEINPSYERSIGSFSLSRGRGKHQTKEVVLLKYLNAYIADTPGFSAFDLKMEKNELAKYFPGFHDYALKCFYRDCLHLHENKCEIKKAVAEKKIPELVYQCYLKLLEEL